ncbi:3-phosphoshikimate 1-carboxyvinyltransferase [Halobacillus litoralis]|uniref:3-phosphoshikimate 1-carboxyvinyltransferase n=1 Tax=Halobacillus litoralis TaxID=45668 RepID=UPI001CD2D1DD|nr:3-phosphoshikimate 1-carboxyvinyltransferase [Halobacillus litoralis]MCA0970354.1 3-phosphoshikimate 1-carboxyvinyltransferase [Halobacillus litoralis]
MSEVTLESKTKGLSGEVRVPGDKSISHRAVIFSSLAEGTSTITNFLTGEDCFRTVEAFRQMGVNIEEEGSTLKIHGQGVQKLTAPTQPINFGNSGTTARLMSGVLSALPFFTTAYGDESLSKRPMDRVVLPLKEMGAVIHGRNSSSFLPLAFSGTTLRGMRHELKVRSAQVKSALLLAGLLSEGDTTVVEKGVTRDHTEKLLPQYGVDLEVKGSEITISGGQALSASDLQVPGDISSAAFFMVAAAITPGSEVTIRDVGLNETRNGIVTALERMGASIDYDIHTYIGDEPVGDVRVSTSTLEGVTIEGELIANLIDEIPILALAATQAEGETVIKDAEELRVKETDRIYAVVENLKRLGADIEARDDGMVIKGGRALNGGVLDSFGDHRIGMMAAIASLVTEGPVTILDKECINISYPPFFEHLDQLR